MGIKFFKAGGGISDHALLSNLTYALAGHTGFLQDTNDVIKDTHIDWGVGLGQVSASDMPNEDIGDITITSGVWSVDDDSHNHTTATIADSYLLNTGDTGTGAYNITTSTDVVPLTLTGGGAGTSNLLNLYNKDNVLASYIASSGSQVWYFGGALVTNIQYTTPAGYPGIVGTYSSSSLWTLGGKSGQANWSRSGEYGFKHYTTGYMELGNSSDTSLAYAQLFVSNSTGTTRRTLVARAQASQSVSIFECLDSSNNVLLSVASDGDLTFAGGTDIDLSTTTGTKIGTATNQLLGFYNAIPVDQPATISDPTGGLVIDTEARTSINALIDRLQELGLIA